MKKTNQKAQTQKVKGKNTRTVECTRSTNISHWIQIGGGGGIKVSKCWLTSNHINVSK